ncbi:hypothetical protein NEF87_001267 [Candidatus Lokiarchaeum ossiferum]|uniref:DUF998 domain-containing protein n=1 Tax=Candidatus Lokiarchaeum ossiferum TaxID=2951803 RepID=A0ABY6HQ10_9ARCH|nr:hypothetical protein NEF87_001267 [Candidatus Lokiarchaeum sp. B-35]
MYIYGLIGVLIVICAFAQIRFPENYSIFTNTISDQGSILLNPRGHKLWNIGVIIIGISMIPHFIHLFRIMKSISYLLSGISTLFGVISSISLSLIGIFPKDFKVPHFTFAGITFGGIFFMANINLILIIKGFRIYKQQKLSTQKLPVSSILKIVITVAIYFIFNMSFLIFVIQSKISGNIVPFWEWGYLFGIILWLISSTIKLPVK